MAPKSPEFSSANLAKLPEIRTLVLDDSSFDRKRICRMGNGLDFKLRIEEAASVAGLKECLDRQNFDLFLIDYKMPESDGLAALDVIRSHKNQSEAVSIMISGQADQRIAVSAMKNGCQDFILKSDISPDYLRGTVLSALSGSRQFSQYFGDQKPVLNLDEIRSFMQIALEDTYVRSILRETLQEGLRDAVRAVGVNFGLPPGTDMTQFFLDSEQPDSFLFR